MLGKSVSDELQDLILGDQHLRQEWIKTIAHAGGYQAARADSEKWESLRADFVRTHGTSLDDMFGDKTRHAQILSLPNRLVWGKMTEDDWHNLAVLTQHMDSEPGFQAQMLKIFRQWRGEKSSQYQYLADRISCRETGTQRFGTQDQITNYSNCKWDRD
jgi:hypothetical protein